MAKKITLDPADAQVLAAITRAQKEYEVYESLRTVVSPLQLIVEVEEAARQGPDYGQPLTLEVCRPESAD